MDKQPPPFDETKRLHLGDGVYVRLERGLLALTTSDGRTESPPIYLEIDVFEALDAYVKKLKEKYSHYSHTLPEDHK
jgi:hypothetical protein